MFYYLNGMVAELQPGLAVIDCGGVGYACAISRNTQAAIQLGKQAKLYTYCNIREDAFDLFGFASKSEQSCFEMLLGVSGVGPKAALSILSASTPEHLATGIITGDERVLTAAPGIGKKLAQRIMLELKDKLSKDARLNAGATAPAALPLVGESKLADACSALAVLGYSQQEIAWALKDLDVETLSLEEIIRQALRRSVKQ